MVNVFDTGFFVTRGFSSVSASWIDARFFFHA